jgi:hypothetical protein
MPRERTRVLRMLRDEGGRIADEESQVYLIESRSEVVFDSPPPGFMQPAAPRQTHREGDPPPKQAVIVGLARAMAEGPQQRKRRPSAPPPSPPPTPGARAKRPSVVPPLQAGRDTAREIPQSRARRPSAPPPRPKQPTRPPPSHFQEAPTRQVDSASSMSAMLAGERDTRDDFSDEATRAVNLDAGKMLDQMDRMEATDFLSADVIVSEDATGAINIDTGGFLRVDHEEDLDESTRAVDVSNLARLDQVSARELARRPTSDEATRNVDLDSLSRADSLSDVDWDLD